MKEFFQVLARTFKFLFIFLTAMSLTFIVLLTILHSVINARADERPAVLLPLQQNTYRVTTDGGNRGTGFVARWEGKRVLITNWHLCIGAYNDELNVESDYYQITDRVHVLYRNSTHDLCVARAPTGPSKGLQLGSYPDEDTKIYSVGYPGGQQITWTWGYPGKEQYVGLVYLYPGAYCPTEFEPVGKDGYYRKCLLRILVMDTTLLGKPGVSGSPVTDERGKIVGIVNSTNKEYSSMIPVRFLVGILQTISSVLAF